MFLSENFRRLLNGEQGENVSPVLSIYSTFKSNTAVYDTEQDGVKIASHTNLAYLLHPKTLKNLSCKLLCVPKYYIK